MKQCVNVAAAASPLLQSDSECCPLGLVWAPLCLLTPLLRSSPPTKAAGAAVGKKKTKKKNKKQKHGAAG